MEEIEQKLRELWEMLQTIPTECKGADNLKNRHKYLKIRSAIYGIISELD